MAESDHQQEPLAWLKTNSLRNPGLLFYGAVIEYLAESEGRYLLAKGDRDPDKERQLGQMRKERGTNTLRPETDAQVAAYNAFCQAVRDALQCSATDPHRNIAKDGKHTVDSFTGPLLERLRAGDIRSALHLWINISCPGDGDGDGDGCDASDGQESRVRTFLRQCRDANAATLLLVYEDENENENAYDAVAIVSYRCAMARVAEDFLDCSGIQRPGNGEMSCLLWDRDVWQHGVACEFNVPVEKVGALANFVVKHLYQDTESFFLPAMIRPAPEQGPIFWRPVQYIIAAAVEDTLRRKVSRVDAGLEPKSAYETNNYLASTAGLILTECQIGIEISKTIAQKCPEVRRLGREWAKTMRIFLGECRGKKTVYWVVDDDDENRDEDKDAVDYRPASQRLYNAFVLVTYRFNMAMMAENLLDRLGIERPDNGRMS